MEVPFIVSCPECNIEQKIIFKHDTEVEDMIPQFILDMFGVFDTKSYKYHGEVLCKNCGKIIIGTLQISALSKLEVKDER